MISKQLISEIKKRLLSRFELDKIILFGSQAREEADDKSDIDLLLIGKVAYDRFSMLTDSLRVLSKLNYAFDVVILSKAEFDKNKNIPGTIARYAYKEGKVLYEKKYS